MTIPKRIVILGGGTAGWMAACLMQQRWGPRGTAVTLIESSDIGIIGVGEGSTPQLKHFFDRLGLAETEWMPRCNATYKVGIGFEGWSHAPGHERYFHPFTSDFDPHTLGDFFANAYARRNGFDVPAHPDRFLVPGRLAADRRGPFADEAFPFEVSYGYHFDAVLLGRYLREVATARGVTHVDTRIASVDLGPDGDVAALVADDGTRFEADLFVDASGFRALVVEQALGEPHIGFGENLFNDRAVVAPSPLPPEGPGSATRATALSAGWAWHIPLTHRVGNGYVYSSRFIADEEAAAELRAHAGLAPDAEVRHLTMRVGRLERSWVRNALAIGLSQGFVEPLEATALHIVLATVEGFIVAAESPDEPAARDAFNAAIARRYDGIRDYIVAHYRAAKRADTDYWRAVTANDTLSDELKAMFTAWFTGADIAETVAALGIGGYYSPMSWHCLFGGYGNYPGRLQPPPATMPRADMARIDRFGRACAGHFAPHREALARLECA
ncbi:tryptophan halogenase family protein [Sphingomonas sp. ASV193]|uniref:tryptophan halogenase family protein n=1 Tax=Sphingomonas sp. ASV193 TaxID=3144405 RepID=UPI0032E9003F